MVVSFQRVLRTRCIRATNTGLRSASSLHSLRISSAPTRSKLAECMGRSRLGSMVVPASYAKAKRGRGRGGVRGGAGGKAEGVEDCESRCVHGHFQLS